MKRVCANRLRHEAHKYDSLQQCISQLEDQGHISQLFDIVYTVCSKERSQL